MIFNYATAQQRVASIVGALCASAIFVSECIGFSLDFPLMSSSQPLAVVGCKLGAAGIKRCIPQKETDL